MDQYFGQHSSEKIYISCGIQLQNEKYPCKIEVGDNNFGINPTLKRMYNKITMLGGKKVGRFEKI